jgi:hypothetical protein
MSSADYAQLLKTLCLATVREEDKVALCVGEMFGLSFVIRGKVSKLEGTEAESTSLDGEATIRLSLLTDGLTFEYKEPRAFPDFAKDLSEEARTAMSLMLEFPNRGFDLASGTRNRIRSFAEMI